MARPVSPPADTLTAERLVAQHLRVQAGNRGPRRTAADCADPSPIISFVTFATIADRRAAGHQQPHRICFHVPACSRETRRPANRAVRDGEGGSPCTPKSSAVFTSPTPKTCCQYRLTATRVVSGCSADSIHCASPSRFFAALRREARQERPPASPGPPGTPRWSYSPRLRMYAPDRLVRLLEHVGHGHLLASSFTWVRSPSIAAASCCRNRAQFGQQLFVQAFATKVVARSCFCCAGRSLRPGVDLDQGLQVRTRQSPLP